MTNKNAVLVFLIVTIGSLFMPKYVEAAEEVASVPIENIFQVPKSGDSYVDGNNVIITDKKTGQNGGVFSTEENKIDLSQDFAADINVNIDGDGDGLIFALHNDQIKTQRYSGNNGENMGIYGTSYFLSSNKPVVDGDPLRYSVAIEFDTYFNRTVRAWPQFLPYGTWGYDQNLEENNGNGHIAYTFPYKASSYAFLNTWATNYINHSGVQYPSFKLGDGQWRLLKIKWTGWDSSNNGTLTYSYGGLAPISVPVSRDTFGTDSVYWGFIATTAQAAEKNMVSFKSVPGLVNYADNVEFKNANGEKIQSATQDSEVTVHYAGQYTSGKQNMLPPTYTFTLSPYQKYQYGTFQLNGVAVTPSFKNNELSIPLSKVLTLEDGKVDIQFKVKDIGVSSDTDLTLTAHVKAQNFLSDNDYTYRLNYDKEAPTGTGKLTFIDVDDAKAITNVTDYRSFLSEYQDNYSSKDKITVQLKENQAVADIVKTVGPSSFQVTLTDEKGNTGDVTVPIFIQNENSVKSSKYIIYGNDFSVDSKNYPKTDESLLTMIREKAGLKLWQYEDLSVKELTNTQLNLSVTKLPPTSASFDPTEGGIYELSASYGSGTEEVDKKLNMTVIPTITKVNIDFVDEKGTPIIEGISFDAKVGESIDLSNNPQIKEKIDAVKSLNYVLDKVPTDEKNLLVTPNINPKYTFKGTLFIQSAPNTINFGDQNVSVLDKTYANPEYDQDLIIWDNRQTLGTWKITLKQSQDFSIPDDPSQKLPDVLSYQTAGEEKMISTDAQEVFSSKHQSTGKYDISQETWGPEKQGLRLNVPVGSVKQIGKYETTLTWQIEEAY
ncbi:WxL domain-containing protein [Enterococcus ureilyticus]|uniref:WxL domain-containing protein n=1 Tax=Enterococcus ureilyticus TaxID=1131292 RepID=UPI001A92E001|nr:WxL domain-containing protein [Enterococcus ureilyticus]MBO0447658.1 WxL domain-containing protein [Enterococcus ureilyticus]